jgi:hypothetical protein
MIPTHVMGSHGFPGWFWTALDNPSAVWTEMEAVVVFGRGALDA